MRTKVGGRGPVYPHMRGFARMKVGVLPPPSVGRLHGPRQAGSCRESWKKKRKAKITKRRVGEYPQRIGQRPRFKKKVERPAEPR